MTIVSFPTSKVVTSRSAPPVFKQSWLFDFNTKDLVIDPGGKVVMAEPYIAWMQWCMFAVLIERYIYPIYSRQYGVSMQRDLRMTPRGVVEGVVRKDVKEATMQTRRTADAKDFIFTWVGDQVGYAITLVPIVGSPKTVSVPLANTAS